MTLPQSSIEVRWRRGVALGFALVAGVLSAVGIVAMLKAEGAVGQLLVGVLCAIFFALGTFVFLRRALVKQPLIVFSADGLHDPTGAFGFGYVGWPAVSVVEIGEWDPRRPLTVFSRLWLRIVLDVDRSSASGWRRYRSRFLTKGKGPTTIAVPRFAIRLPKHTRSALAELAPTSVAVT